MTASNDSKITVQIPKARQSRTVNVSTTVQNGIAAPGESCPSRSYAVGSSSTSLHPTVPGEMSLHPIVPSPTTAT
jgi:hypothetical protein